MKLGQTTPYEVLASIVESQFHSILSGMFGPSARDLLEACGAAKAVKNPGLPCIGHGGVVPMMRTSTLGMTHPILHGFAGWGRIMEWEYIR